MARMWRVALFSVLAGTPVLTAAQERPLALEMAQRQRELLQTGQVEFRCQRQGDLFPTRLYSARFGDESDAVSFLGDESGVFYVSDGTVDTLRRGPHVALNAPNETWDYDGDGISCGLAQDPKLGEHLWKLRALGLTYFNTAAGVQNMLLNDEVTRPRVQRYTESVENGLHVVRAETDHGATTWYIDPQRGWNPVRVTAGRDDQVAAESRITLREYDGVWYPATVEFYQRGSDRPVEVISVTSAAFNHPDQPHILKPADIGIEAGMNVEARKADGKYEFMKFDGEKAVSLDEFAKRYWAGEIKYGPSFLRAIAELEAASIGSEVQREPATGDVPSARQRRESEWEAYTRQFISKYHLDDGQSQKALSILRECQQEADQYLLRRKVEFEQLREKMRKLSKAGTPKQDDLSALRQQGVKLRAPLNEIFEKQLKPRLEKLPTRAQRAVAEPEQPATTQPDQAP
jgi:hypothetical protein